ncbi:MAG: hypothetical protein LBQ50_08430 [Planctomycetaceae bacterium]|nr:hypothetical protein [Planctomycetaceae bacterium]
MARKSANSQTTRTNHNVRLPITQDDYQQIVRSPVDFRCWLTEQAGLHPELFPPNIAGFHFKDRRTSKKLNVTYRRIILKDKNLRTIRPAFVPPYMTAFTDDVRDILFLSRWGTCPRFSSSRRHDLPYHQQHRTE